MATQILPTPNKVLGIEEALAANTLKGQMERPRKFNGLRKTRLKQVSPKMQKQLVAYREVKRIWWAARLEIDGGRCQFARRENYRCLFPASSSPHHIMARGRNLSNSATFMACCNFHHDWIHKHPNAARKLGFLKT